MENESIREMISQKQIAAKVRQLGDQISEDYKGKDLLLIALLKGSFIFAADLIRHLDLDVQIDFMKVSSYQGENSCGEVRILKDLDEHVHGRDLLIVEDIIDTGLTLTKIIELLKSRNPASLEIVTLLDKPSRRVQQVETKYVGFQIEDRFVVGYGLDRDEAFRQLPYIGEITAD